jgi:nicotinamidase-related amidase
MKTALLIIDIQNDYFEGGTMTLAGSDSASMNAALVLDRFRTNNMPVVHIQHIATKPTATFFLPGTFGADIHKNVTPLVQEKSIYKAFSQ